MAALYWLKRPIAHRGLHDATRGIIENSASAIRAAIGKGYAVEVDLQCAAGDMPVVFHDATLDRLTHESGPVSARDVESLRAISLKGSNDKILSLPDLLGRVGGYVPLMLEVKSTWTRDGRFEANIVKQLAGYTGPVAVMSFDPYSVAAFRRAAPDLPRGLVAERFAGDHWQDLSRRQRFAMRHLLTAAFAQPHFIAYDIQALPAAAPLIAKTVCGLPLLTWTVRTDAERERALCYADAMIFEGIEP
ncbi:MAG: glycerophosphodiester phosphodiesterase family protein [Methyloceanibacter sp.]|uniref:glycerophosphodiester phosphodiesterase family protein n=1 Tax=Methyloceanibacter sp. TaxID=1965321 RepID=UPI003EE2C3E0